MKQLLKRLISPIYRQKLWIERLQYRGRPIHEGQTGHDLVRRLIESGPALVGKIGESELRGVISYLKHRKQDGSCDVWSPRADRLYHNAGVFPHSPEAFTAFAKEFLSAMSETDALAVWYNRGEARVVNECAPNANLVGLTTLEPHLWQKPWFEWLNGKRLLVISPFADTVCSQHPRLAEVWQGHPEMAADFELETIRTPLAACLVESPYPSWAAGLDDLRAQMDRIDFDLAVIGAGAWSLPLAAHAKRLGKVGVHLGGTTQLLFGIRGARWDVKPKHSRFFNEHWVRPDGVERPDTVKKIEDGCYW